VSANTSDISKFLDLVEIIIVVIDSDQKVGYINKKGCEILGYEKEDILGKNWFDIFLPEKIRKDLKTVFNKLMHGEIELVKYFDNVVLTKAGQERIIGWHNTVLTNERGTIIGILSLGEDITERRRTDDKFVRELQDRVTELKAMRMNIPICALDKKDLTAAINKHYRNISTEGKCSECLHVVKMAARK
jgi:PAS domain S-box-containing protein